MLSVRICFPLGRKSNKEEIKIVSPGKILQRCFHVVDSISENTGKILSWLILPLVGIFCWEVLLRGVFNAPTIWAHESTQYFFGVYFMLGGAYAMKLGSMVNVDIVVKGMKPRARAILDGVTGLFTFTFLIALMWKGLDFALWSVKINEMSQTPWGPPIYPFKIAVVVGASLMCLQVLTKYIRDIILAISGKVVEP